MKQTTMIILTAAAISIPNIFLPIAPVNAEPSSSTGTVNLICGRDDDQDTYYSEVALSEREGTATLLRRSNGRTVGPNQMTAIFTPTEVQFENADTRRGITTTEIFVISRIDLTMTRWVEASFSQEEPRKSVLQCSLASVPSERAF